MSSLLLNTNLVKQEMEIGRRIELVPSKIIFMKFWDFLTVYQIFSFTTKETKSEYYL